MKTFILTLIAISFSFSSFAFSGDTEGEKKRTRKEKKEASAAAAPKVYKASINQRKGDLVAVHFMKLPGQKVTITIKDESGKTLYSESVKKYNQMIKKYDLNEFPAGEYKVEINNGSEKLIKKVTL